MSESQHSPTTKWILICTAILGLVAALFVAVARYYDIQTARAEAERAQEAARIKAERADPKIQSTILDKSTSATINGMTRFREDFGKAVEGALPDGWTGDDAISVRRGGDRARLEVAGKGQQAVTLPKLRIEGDFYLECEFTLAWERPRLELTLEGKDDTPSLVLAATATGGGTNVASTLRVTLGDLDARESMKGLEPPLYKLRLERQGEIYRVKVNGESVVAQTVRGYGDFTGVRLALPGESEAKFYSIQVGPLVLPKNP